MKYIINNNTLSMMAISENETKIVEKNKVLVVNEKCSKIISENCKSYGSSYTSRLQISKFILKSNAKIPIFIDDNGKLLIFPTNSNRINSCIWLNYNNIIDYKKNGKKKVVIVFTDDTRMIVPISYYSFEKQMTKCMKLKLSFLERKMSFIYTKV